MMELLEIILIFGLWYVIATVWLPKIGISG
jgi:hypothetical protein